MTTETALCPADLDQFTGTETHWRHSLNRYFLYTDGVKYLAERAGAYWFLDAIALGVHGRKGWVPHIVPHKTTFAVITMTVKNGDARCVIQEDTGTPNLGVFKTSTDCPDGEWKFYLSYDGEQVVIMIPSEY
jgi:hypothetical protein